MRHERIPVAYRAPFDFNGKVWVQHRPPGESILEIVRAVPVLPANFLEHGYVCINGQIVPRERWAFVRPKPTSIELPVSVTLHVALGNPGGGGGSSGTKSVIALVAALALVVITAGLASPVAAAAFPLLGTSLIGVAGIATVGQVVAGVVGIAGALAIGALTAPPTTTDQTAPDTNTDNREPAGAQGNVIDKGGAIPRVLGTRKVYPPLAGEPVVQLDHQDETVEAVFVLNGPHQLNDIRLEGTDIFAAEDVEVETREGWDDDTDLTLVTRQGRMQTPNLELSGYQIASSDFQRLDDQSTPANSLPVFHNFTSRSSPDEIWFHFACPGGLSNGSVGLQLPLRISFRRRGDSTWINLPELHLGATSTRQLRSEIRFKWITASFPVAGTTAPSTNNGWVYAYTAPTPQSATPATPTAWVCNSWFDSGNGSDTKYWYAGSPGTTRVQNISFGENTCEVYLDAGTFPQGIYEFQIKRGTSLVQSSFTKSGYQYLGQIRDFFWYVDSGGVHNCPVSQAGFSDHTLVTRVQSIWNTRHLSTPGKFALIAVKAVNRTLRQLSTIASGYVQDNFDGDAWNDWTTTSNPAPHYRDVLTGALNLDPLPTDQIDDATLQFWRYLAQGNDWTIDAIINDMRTQDVLSLIASCGYARPYQSDQYGVTIDNDRWAYAPVQVFSRRNAAGMRFEKAFPRVPAGLIVTYRDESKDDDQAQTVVAQRDAANSDLTSYESISYDGLLTEAKVRTRALFDLDQANLRSTFYYVDADIESIVARRGDLVAMQHDMMTDRAGDGYITSIQRSGGDIIGVTLDSQILIHADGQTGLAIRHTDGTISVHLLSNTPDTLDNVLTFVDPYPDPGTIEAFEDNFPENIDRRYGSMAVAGHINETYRHYLVQNVQPGRDLTAQLTLVDEANALERSNTFIDIWDDDPGLHAFIVPDGCHNLLMEVWGGGGGGSGPSSSQRSGGAGGGFSSAVRAVNPGDLIFYYIGNGGSGQDGNGDGGEDSWVNINDDNPPGAAPGLIAQGGTGGGATANPAGGTGVFGDENRTGGAGGAGGSSRGGGGGGGAGPGTNGSNGASGNSGGGGGTTDADGGQGETNVNGGDGQQASGGGGAARTAPGIGGRGGDGLAHFLENP